MILPLLKKNPRCLLFTFVWVLLFGTLPAFGQRDSLDVYLQRLNSLEGKEQLDQLIQIADTYYQRLDFEKAAARANEAYQKAGELAASDQMAKALQVEALALLQIPSRRFQNRTKALQKLRESQALTSDFKLKMENLKILKSVALSRRQPKEVKKIEEEIQALRLGKKENLAQAIQESGLLSNKRKAQQVMAAVATENEGLSKELQKLQEERLRIESENMDLVRSLESQDSAIVSMSEAQAKAELLIAQQRMMVDSLFYRTMLDSLNIEKTAMILERQEEKIRLQNSRFLLLLLGVLLVLLLAVGIYSRYRGIRKHNKELEGKNEVIRKEQQRSEDLLLNILPKSIAEELKAEGAAQARQYKNVTVLFSDFKGFTKIAKELSPDRLVKSLDYCFKEFDGIIEKHGLEKIKTIGDAYMCAGGLPDPDPDHPKKVIRAALEMQAFLHEWQQQPPLSGLQPFEARLGIHTGPIVAGVVGIKKFAYDIWGDTVNIASRMESNGVSGKVNISADTYELIKDEFLCTPRGKVPVKNLGEVEMYFVEKSR